MMKGNLQKIGETLWILHPQQQIQTPQTSSTWRIMVGSLDLMFSDEGQTSDLQKWFAD